MAQTKKKRRRKHRGTQAGTVERPGRTGRAQTRTEAREIARKRRAERLDRPPTWRGSLNRAAIAAAIFGVAVVLLLGQPPLQGALLAGAMVLLYLPMTYYTDLFVYRRRRRRRTGGGGSGEDRSLGGAGARRGEGSSGRGGPAGGDR